MNVSEKYWVYKSQCKDCKKPFGFTETALTTDVAHGLSTPLRCPECRKNNGAAISEAGLSYWPIPLETDFTRRSIEEVGLGKLDHGVDPPQKAEYQSNASVAEQFQILQPAVDELIQNLLSPHGSRVSILVGPTGTGKSVWATSQILRSPIGREGRILVTQPRTVTLRAPEGKGVEETTPGYIATKLLNAPGVGAGHEVGFLYKGESTQHDRYTRLLFVTDGLLIKWILSGEIGRYSVIMIDEAHEQSSNMELIFALLRYKLPLYPRLRLVIMSATVDDEKFQEYFQNFGSGTPKIVPVFKPDKEVTRKPIYDRWPDGEGKFDGVKIPNFKLPKEAKDLPEATAQLVWAIREKEGFTKLERPYGDILVFAPTTPLVYRTKEAIEELELKNLEVFPCHAKMNNEEREALLESEKQAEEAYKEKRDSFPQRIIVATNYAETSVTFSNLRYVIESGYILEPKWNSQTCSREYAPSRHSQAGCTQRKGRVGRQQEGEVFRLYTKEQFEKEFRPTPLPEIARSNLDMFLLRAAAAGIDDLQNFRWLGLNDDDTQDTQRVEKERAITVLKKRGALDNEGDVTKSGFQLEGIQANTIDLALFMAESDAFACSLEVATFLAFVESNTSPFTRNETGLLSYERWRTGCYDDLEFYLRLFHHWQKSEKYSSKKYGEWLEQNSFNPNAFEEIAQKRGDILQQFSKRTHTPLTKRELDLERLHRVRLVLARCMPEWVYVRNANDTSNRLFIPQNQEVCPCSDPVEIDRESACALVDGITAFICVERATTKNTLFARHVVRVKPEWLSKLTNSGLIGLSIMLRQTIEGEDRTLSEGCRKRVVEVPKQEINVDFYNVGDVRKFRFIRSQSNDEEGEQKTLLVRDADTNVPCLVRFQERDKKFIAGTIFRASIEGIDRKRNSLTVNQWKLYPKNTRVENAKITKERTDNETGKLYAYTLELEPDIVGRLRIKNLGQSEEWLKQLQAGTLPLMVDSASQERIELVPFTPPLVEGNRYEGYVVYIFPGKNGYERSGVKIEIAPHVEGVIHYSEVSTAKLLSYELGDRVSVILAHIREDGKLDLKPFESEYSSPFEDVTPVRERRETRAFDEIFSSPPPVSPQYRRETIKARQTTQPPTPRSSSPPPSVQPEHRRESVGKTSASPPRQPVPPHPQSSSEPRKTSPPPTQPPLNTNPTNPRSTVSQKRTQPSQPQRSTPVPLFVWLLVLAGLGSALLGIILAKTIGREDLPPPRSSAQETPHPLKTEASATERLYTLLESRRLSEDEVKNWSNEEIQEAINLMLARHGYPFTGNRFRNEDWFAPVEGRTANQIEKMFSPVEKHNWELLAQQRNRNRQQNNRSSRPPERTVVLPETKPQIPQVRSSQRTMKEANSPKDTAIQRKRLNQFSKVNYPQAKCGDPLPTSLSEYPIILYPVFVDNSEQNLKIIKSQFCGDALERRREKTGIKSIQVASFRNRQRAEEFIDFIKSKVGSGDVGEPKTIEAPPARQEPVTKLPELTNQQSDPSYIGLRLITLTPKVKAQINREPNLGVAVGEESGVLVVEVVPRSPAATVGFLRGDVIRTISGRTVTTSEQVQQIVRDSGVGKKLQVEISRNGEVLSLAVRIDKTPVQYYPE